MFKEKDLKQLKERGISKQQAEQQLNLLRRGVPFIRLYKAAISDDGIRKLNNQSILSYGAAYEQAANDLEVTKFVPASGAATRMFKALHEMDFLCRQPGFDPRLLQNDAYRHVNECFERLEEFAFHSALETLLKNKGSSLKQAMDENNYHLVLSSMLGQDGLNFANLPKGMIPFHSYKDGARTAFEEHLVEAAGYAVSAGGISSIHLTVSQEHKGLFHSLFDRVRSKYELQFGISYKINLSIQKPATDTLALGDHDEVFREADGSMHFRPGGHGALLENLNDTDADLIFIKNIDNVVPDRIKKDTFLYKKALAGLLLEIQKKVFSYLTWLDGQKTIDEEKAREIIDFLKEDLGTVINSAVCKGNDGLISCLRENLNRPIRVCGMVRNAGEPGGGPFWVLQPDGGTSLQIVESSQVNHRNAEQEAMLNSSTHFNPVDLVCGVRDYRGRKFDLLHYRDPDTYFISKKSKNGKPLKALELPGLWNGSMAGWNTVFVEVPPTTFSPVKVLQDLLKPEHQ